jgi:transposase-like protein
MARGSPHSDETRAAVIAALLTGEGVSDISRRMQLPKQTVSRIRTELAPEQLGQVGTEKATKMETLIESYLASNVAALKAICDVTKDASYLKRQSADALATLHAELATRAFRLFEAEAIEEG